MRGSEEFVQRMVHALEMGFLSVWVQRTLVAAVIFAMAVYYLWPAHFRGLATSEAMDQAQIGREIASGHGWRTQLIRPRAVAQLQAQNKNVKQKIWRDTYNAPLPPLLDAIALLPVKPYWKLRLPTLVYAGDRAIAVMSILFFIGSVIVLFFLARRLFDQRLALLACGLVLFCDMMWQYSLSGLPQMLMLLLFNATLYALVRAIETQLAGALAIGWLLAVGAGFGLLALSHALTLWMFLGLLIFACFYFQPRGWSGLFLAAPAIVLYAPWLIRNFVVCGNPFGIAMYAALNGIVHSEADWMRRGDLSVAGVGPAGFRDKILANLVGQSGHILEYLGFSIVAAMFFVSLLYSFKRSQAAVLRWMILAMWGGAVFGMAVYGINEELGVAANQLHLLFVPIMTCYGLAFLLVQWNRLLLGVRFARIGFIALLYFLCAMPMIFGIPWWSPPKSFIRWPPYVPAAIAILNDWLLPNETTASDMPWAIAWYADRPGLWIPDTVKAFTDYGDYETLGVPVNSIYLTPISGTENKFRDIVKGEYKDWSAVIQRTQLIEKFPLKWNTLAVGFEGECIFLSDHDREHSKTTP
jgi:hypothetical protein